MIYHRSITSIFFIVIFICFIFEIAESRPKIRHHKDSQCSRCSPGWGVLNLCTENHDTECKKCQSGSYSPHHSFHPCWICSRCGPGLYEAHSCTSKMDTVCDSCHRHAPNNLDYIKKCHQHYSLFLAPEDAKNTGEETSLINDRNHILDETEREAILEKDIKADFLNAQNYYKIQTNI